MSILEGGAGQPARPGPDDSELGATVYDIVRDLREDVATTGLPLRVKGLNKAINSRDRLVTQLDEHLLPRMKELSSPAVVVVAGSTGAGKSTLFNSILGEDLSRAGVLRPTTREPVFAYNPADEDVLIPSPTTEMSRVVTSSTVPRGAALLDAPDLDSLLAENRETAAQLLEAADLWLFVTTAARYGDALPWHTLTQAKDRGAAVAMVLNRVPQDTLATIRSDLLARLRSHGLESTPLFVIPDLGPHEGPLEEADVAPIRRWLSMLAGPDRSRTVIVRTLKGALDALPNWVAKLADAVDAQIRAADAIRATVGRIIPELVQLATASIVDGSAAQGALAARWAQLSADRVVRVKIRNGIARSSARRGRRREAALTPLFDEALRTVRHGLVAAGNTAFGALESALVGPPGLPGGETVMPSASERLSAREKLADEQLDLWVAATNDLVTKACADPSDARAQAALRAFGRRGMVALGLAAASGCAEALLLLERTLGVSGIELVADVRSDLSSRAAVMVEREADPVRDAVAIPELAADADARLQVRLAELRRLM